MYSLSAPFFFVCFCIVGEMSTAQAAAICDQSAHLEMNSMLLADNSAVNTDTTTLCVVPHCNNSLYNVVWFQRNGNNPVVLHDSSNGDSQIPVIYATKSNDITFLSHAANPNLYDELKGVYTCKISNITTNETLYTLHLGFFIGVTKETGPSIITPILNIIQHYPLIAEIKTTTKDFPPTNVYWFKDNIPIDNSNTAECGIGHSLVLKDGKISKYELTLNIKQQPQCTYSGEYNVTVNTNGGGNVTTESLNITQTPSPSNITLISVTSTSITITWNLPSTQPNNYEGLIIDHYCVAVQGNISSCTEDNSTFELAVSIPHQAHLTATNTTTGLSVDLLSIGPSNSIPSQPETMNIALEYPILSSVQLLLVNNSAVEVTWSRYSFNEHQYLIPIDLVSINITSNCSLLDKTTLEWNVIDKMASRGSHVLDNLHPSTQYCTTVALHNPWGSSGLHTECIVTSSSASTVPSSAPEVMNITNKQQYCSSVQISWFPIPCLYWNGLLSHYILCFSEELPLQLTINQTNYSCDVIYDEYNDTGYSEVKGLKYYAQYRVRIARVNIGNLTGPYSNASDFNTTECNSEPPTDFEVTATSIKSIEVKWSPPSTKNGVLQSYILRYNMPGQQASVDRHTIMLPLINSTTITELYPNTSYTITIAAVNGAGESHSTSTSANTNAIGAVSNLTVESLVNSIRIQWIKLSSVDIDSYKISYTRGTSEEEVVRTHRPTTRDGSSPFAEYILAGIANNTRYTVSLAAAVVVNESVEVIGPWTNTSGCHGNCQSDEIINIIYFISSVVFLLIIVVSCCCICIILYTKGRKGRRYGHQPLMIEMQKGGKAPSLISKPEDQYVTEGSDVVLVAPVTGQPFPLITWFYNDDIIADDEHFELDEDNDSQLMLQNVLLSHAGVYRFSATNTLGSVEGHIRIFVEPEKEKCPPEETTDGSGVRLDTNGQVNGHAGTTANEEDDDVCIVETEPISLNELADYISKMNRKHKREFKRQFGNLQCFENILSFTFGNSPEHKHRNRFQNIFPFDNNRIVLQQIEGRGDCNHTYINASYIDGFTKPKQFIATQGPLPTTLVDFWRLIWQENVQCIVLLLKDLMEGGLIRCQQYWPDNGTAFYGPYKVTLSSKKQYTTHIKRTLILAPVDSSNNEHLPRTVHHLQFTDWPDHGLPSSVSPLVSFIGTLEEEWLTQGDTPTLVHCSAGIGRTGVLLSVIIGMEMGRQSGQVDVLGTVNTLRKQRMKMIQTEEQYAFIHYAVLEGLYCEGSGIDPINLRLCMRKMETPKNGLTMNCYEAQFKAVSVLSPNPDEVSRNKGIENPRLSRSKLFLPPDDHRVVLQKKDNDFIHASFLSGYKQDKGFIIAESPTIKTVQLFWQMIMEQKCAVIVMLCDCTELEKNTCYPYWPASNNSIQQFGDFKIKNIEEHFDKNYTELYLQVTGIKERQDSADDTMIVHDSCDIHQLQVLQWSPSGESSDHQSIIATISRIEVIQRQTGNRPVLIHCSDTVTRSGVFCTLYKSIQQCKAEQVVDIYQMLKSLRLQKPGLIPNVYMYKMVYKLLARYLESEFEIYKNFSKSTECLVAPPSL